MVLDGNQQYLVGEFAEDYREGRMGRRELLRRVLLVTGSIGGAATALREFGVTPQGADAAAATVFADRKVFANVTLAEMRGSQDGEAGAGTLPPAQRSTANVVAEDDPEIVAGMVEFPGEAGPVFGYLARPNRDGQFPGMIVIHENRGLIEPNMDIARRFAKEGFVALAVDLLSRLGGTGAFDSMAVTGAIGQTTNDGRAADMTAGVEYLKTLPSVNAAAGFGITGYCFGGAQVYLMAARNPDIRAAVPFYGTSEPPTLAGTSAAILAVYAEDDPRITGQLPEVEAVMQRAGKTFEAVVYPATQHAFFNNTGERYNPTASQDAWRRTLAWFATHLHA